MGFVRRSGRIAKEIRILLIGTDTSGRVFAEETQTVTLSRHGAGVISKHKLAADGILILRFLGGNSEASIRLVGELGEDLRGYIYGVTFVDPNLDFWELKFPPPPKWRVNFEAPLQCTSCQNHEVVDQSEVEADVYALAEFILRPCSICGTSTQWRRATEDDVAVPANPATRGLEAQSRFVASPLQLGSARSGEPLATVSQHRRWRESRSPSQKGCRLSRYRQRPPPRSLITPIDGTMYARGLALPLVPARIAWTRSLSAATSRKEVSRSAAVSRIWRVPTLMSLCPIISARSLPSCAPPCATPWCCRTAVSITASCTR
jgi:hypothetical protein